MKLKHFQSMLEGVKGFSEPDFRLEQYKTSAHLAAVMLMTIEDGYGDIEGHAVADLGCASATSMC